MAGIPAETGGVHEIRIDSTVPCGSVSVAGASRPASPSTRPSTTALPDCARYNAWLSTTHPPVRMPQLTRPVPFPRTATAVRHV